MIARELTEFFAGFSPNGTPVVRGPDEQPFLSNVNACYRRSCWQELRFADLPYAEDQAFARAMADAGWLVAYHPGAAVLHAHDYSPLGFMRRYFDEYRGLRETIGHVERLGVRSTARDVRGLVAADRRWMRRARLGPKARLAWTARSALHHGGRKVFSALGSRAPGLPEPVQRAISLERAATNRSEAVARIVADRSQPVRGGRRSCPLGTSAAARPGAGHVARERLHVAVVIPRFKRGSGGHSTIYNLLTRLEDRGHTITTWLYDPLRRSHGPVACSGQERSARVLSADPGSCVQGLRPVVRCRCRARNRLGHRVPGPPARPLPYARVSRAGPRAGVLRHVRRVAVGATDLRLGPVLHRRERVAARSRAAIATARRRRTSTSASTTSSTSRDRSSDATTR